MSSNQLYNMQNTMKHTPSKFSISRMYGLLKIHKTNTFEDIPLKPVRFMEKGTSIPTSHRPLFLKPYILMTCDKMIKTSILFRAEIIIIDTTVWFEKRYN